MRKRISSGFTLIEVVIVLAILAFLTVNTAIAIRNGFRTRAKIRQQVQDMSQVRDSLRVIERDLNVAFHYRDLEEEFRAELKKASAPARPPTPPGGVPPPPPPPTPPDPKELQRRQNRKDPTTHFVGSAEEMNFATLNSGRLSADLKQADFIKVGYSLKNCRNPVTDTSVQCLIRRESPLVEGDITKGGVEVVLLRDVTEFKLRYFGHGKQDWNSEWNSTVGDAASKNSYPQAVEISLTIERGEKDKKKRISMQTIAAIHFPNNQDKGPGNGLPEGGSP